MTTKISEKYFYEKIYINLLKGCFYGEYVKGLPMSVLSLNKLGHICWQHFGSSCCKNTKRNLEWIITEIFGMTPEEFDNQYGVFEYNNNGYIKWVG